ncbi:hypothetical protein [Bacillus cereus]|uniref:hypothetical protein n=1 Tax=Bacillus cereus TaxID=1396 RepID=UPI0003303533|nr:hypothetical protein [Bacillus cereus]EOO44157.1 hypothetical protein ICK_06414 [Bacillus cereus BAG1X2-2]EOP00444.1 hypothetical protein ICO_06400 [Bacillus cereus BAG2O-1]
MNQDQINSDDMQKLDEIQDLIEESELKIQEVISLKMLEVGRPDEIDTLMKNMDKMISIAESIESLDTKTIAEENIKFYDNTLHEKMKQI